VLGINKQTAIFVANRGFALYSSRKLLMERLLQAGWQVVALTAPDKYSAKLSQRGVIIEELDVNRGGFSPVSDLKSFWRVLTVYRKYKPDLIHHFHAKPIILGNAAKMIVTNNSKVVNTITGLGYSFVAGGLTKKLASLGYKLFLTGSAKTIFQNRDDQNLFIDNDWLSEENAELIVSSGINLEQFEFSPETGTEKPIVLIVTRLLWQKGVQEFVEAAKIITEQFADVKFQIGGEIDPSHPDAISRDWIEEVTAQENIDFVGYIEDMPKKLQEIDIFVLPSYYREGVPRVLLEASATGKPIITTDSPGCREAVINNQTGKLVAPKDSKALAEAILELINDHEKRVQMGFAGRKVIEEEFDIRKITARYLDVYREIGLKL
jgi:glycosyltransferase involved in cell wall biosynthesis